MTDTEYRDLIPVIVALRQAEINQVAKIWNDAVICAFRIARGEQA